MLSQSQPDSAPLGAVMNTLQRATQWCNTLCSIADEPHTADTAGSRPISVTLVAAILLTDCDSYEKVKMSKHTETFFFLRDSYCFSVSTLLSTEVFTPLSSLTRAWIRWWVCKLRFFFLFACLFLCREISKWAKMLQDKPQDIHIHSAYWSHVWGRSNNSKYQDLNTEVQNGINQQKCSHRNTILISENKPVFKKKKLN